jgi:membrane associated rhomboid family serine protease
MKPYFTELLLSGLAIFFAFLAIWMLKHGVPEDGFKWASALVGTIVGALLMKMETRKKQ